MAYPSVRATTSGNINTSNTYQFSIPMPTMVAGDLLLCFVGTSMEGVVAVTQDIPQTWANCYWVHDRWHNATLSLLIKTAASASETLTVHTQQMNSQCHPTAQSRYAKIAYICYSISGGYIGDVGGVGINTPSNSNGNFRPKSTTGANWDLYNCPERTFTSDAVKDYLWIATVVSPDDKIATVVPSGFGNLITAQGNTLYHNSTSLTSCRITTNAVTQLNPGPFTAPSCDWTGVIMRIHPDSSVPPDSEQVITDGVGTYIYQKDYGAIEPDTISVNPTNQYYNDNGTPDATLNYYGYYVEVISSGSWTASWNTGTNFYASQYSGSEGVTYVAINCNGSNSGPGSLTDTLVFDGPGIASDSVNVEQYAP